MNDLAKTVCDTALQKGSATFRCRTYSDAKILRSRCYTLRIAERRRSRKLYDPTEPGYNSSPYDELTFSVEGNLLIITRLEGVQEVVDVSTGRVAGSGE